MSNVSNQLLGELVMVAIRGRHLTNKQKIGKQSPYVSVTIGTETKRMKSDKNGGQHPEWDDQVNYQIFDRPEMKKMKLAVYAEDSREPDLVGEAEIELTKAIIEGEFDDWIEIKNKGKFTGEIYIELTFYSASTPPKPPKPSEKNSNGISLINEISPVLPLSMRPGIQTTKTHVDFAPPARQPIRLSVIPKMAPIPPTSLIPGQNIVPNSGTGQFVSSNFPPYLSPDISISPSRIRTQSWSGHASPIMYPQPNINNIHQPHRTSSPFSDFPIHSSHTPIPSPLPSSHTPIPPPLPSSHTPIPPPLPPRVPTSHEISKPIQPVQFPSAFKMPEPQLNSRYSLPASTSIPGPALPPRIPLTLTSTSNSTSPPLPAPPLPPRRPSPNSTPYPISNHSSSPHEQYPPPSFPGGFRFPIQ